MRERFPLLRRLATATAVVCILALPACGGGGAGGDKDLAVTFSYDDKSATLFLPSRSSPTLRGLDGNTPKCSVTSGSLPPGQSVGAGCAVVGTPTALGNYSATITLSVDGYKGSVSTAYAVQVLVPFLRPVQAQAPSGSDQSVALGSSVSRLPIVTIGTVNPGIYVPQAGDALLFSLVSGSVPEGLIFDPSDGTLSGVPTAFGVSTLTLTLRITHAGTAFTTVPVSVNIAAVPAPFTLVYGPCCTSITSESVSLPATSTYRPVAGASTGFAFSGEAPTGLTADQSNGTLQGTLTRAGTFVFTVTQTVYLPDGSTVMANSAPLTWVVNGIFLNYEVFTYNIFPGMAFSIDPPVIIGALAGDTRRFALIPTPDASSAGNQSGTPLPPWLNIDASTGRLYGVGGASIAFGYGWDTTVVMTTTRNGRDYMSTTRVEFILN